MTPFPPESREAAAAAIYEILGTDPCDPCTWCSTTNSRSIRVPMLRHAAFEANRESPGVHRAFAQLWGMEGLWATIDQGAFTCLPGFHYTIGIWLEGLPEGADPRQQDLSGLATPGAGRAGDLIVWHHALPRGSRPNRNTISRVVQYLTMFPSQQEVNPIWK
jgi:hypothetical protein